MEIATRRAVAAGVMLLNVIADLRKVAGSGLRPSEHASTGIPAVNQFPDFLVVYELTAVGGGKPFLNFLHEPFIVVDHALHGFNHQRLAIAALLGGKAGELCLQVGVQTHFHGSSLVIAENSVNNHSWPYLQSLQS